MKISYPVMIQTKVLPQGATTNNRLDYKSVEIEIYK